jgi:hypothetical protein
MKVLDLRCANGHGFEGWFGSEEDFQAQLARGLVECPACADRSVARLPSAPRLNLSGAREHGGVAEPSESRSRSAPAEAQPGAQERWVQIVRRLLDETEDVGDRFPEEARRIHYGEVPQRGIRGQATDDERAALRDEGIEVVAIPVPPALKGPLQ